MSDTGDFATRIGIEASVSGVESVAGLSTGVASLSQQLINLSNAALKGFSVQEQLNAAMEKTRRSVGALASARVEEAKNTQLSIRATQEYTQQLNALSQAQSRVSAAGKMTPQLAAGFKTQSTYLNQAAGSAGALADALNNPNISQFGTRMMKQGQAAQRSAYYMAAATMPLLLGLKSAFFSMIKLETETVRLKKLVGDAFSGATDAVDQTNKAVNDLSLQLDKITEKFGTSRVLIQSLAGDFAELGLPIDAIARLTEFTAAAEKLGNLDISSSQNFIQSLYQNIVRVKREASQDLGLAFDLTDANTLVEVLDEIQGQLAIFNLVENKTSLSLKDIADAFPEASAAATTFGLTATETAAMLVPMVAAGFQVGASANSIKVSLQRMVAVTKQNTVIMDQLNGSLDNFHVSAGIGMSAIQNLVDGFDALKEAKGAQGALEFFSRLFGVRQGPRMLTSFQQMAAFQKSMNNSAADEYTISQQLEQSVNARLTASGHDAIQVKKIIDLTTLHRGAIEKVNGKYTERAKAIQKGQEDADKALKASFKASNNTADYLGQVSTETGRVYFMEAIGGVKGANDAMQQELNYSISTVTTKFNILRETMLGIGRSIVPIVGVFVDLLLPVVKKVKAFFDGLSLTTKKWIGLMLILPILIPQMKLLGAAVKIVAGGLAQMWTRSISGSTSTLRAIRGLKTELVSLEDLLNNPGITKGYNKLTQQGDTDKFLLQQDPNHAGYKKGFLNSRKMRPGSEGVSLPLQEVLQRNGVVGATDKKSVKALMGKATKTGLPDTEALIHTMLTNLGAMPEDIAAATAKAADKAATGTAEKLTKAMKGTIFQNNTFVGNKFGGGTSGPGGTGAGPRTPKAPTTGGTPTVPTPTVPVSTVPTVPTPSAPVSPPFVPLSPSKGVTSLPGLTAPTAATLGKTATISTPIAAGVKEVADGAKAELEALSKTVTKEVEKATEVVTEATKPKGKSPRGSPAKIKTAVEKTVGEAVSTATAPIESAVAAVTEASTETTEKVEKAVKEVKDKVKAPKNTAVKVKKAVEAVVADTAVAVEKTVAGVAEASAGATAAVEKAAKGVDKATKVASAVTKAPAGQASIVKLSYREIAKFFDDAGQTIPAEYDFIRTTNKEVALTKKAKTEFFKNLTKQFEKGSATPLGKLERPRGRAIYKLFGKEVNAQKDAYKNIVDELLTDRRSLEKAVSVKAQIDSTKASMMVDKQGNTIIPKASGAGKTAEKRLIAEKKRAAEAITAMNAAEGLKADSLAGMAPPPGVEEVYTTRPKAEIAAIEKSLAEAKSNLKIVEKEGTDVAKQLGATYRKQIDDLNDELKLARAAIHEKIIPASPATSQLLNAESRLMRDESPIQNLTSGKTVSGRGIGPNNPIRYANELSDSVGSMPRVISAKNAAGPAVLNPDIRAKILHDLELEKLKQHLLQSTDENIVRDLKSHMSEVADDILDSDTNLTGSGGYKKATAAQLKKIKNEAAGRMAENMGVDLTKYLPTSDEFDPAAEGAILKNKKVVNGVTEFYKGIEHGGDQLVAELASMKTDVSPANISARQKLAKAFIREREAISPSGPGGRTAPPFRKIISGGMGKAKDGVVTVGKLLEESIDQLVKDLPVATAGPIDSAKRKLIRATALAAAASQPGAAFGDALKGGQLLVDKELTVQQAKAMREKLDLMRKQVISVMDKDVAGFNKATITDSKGKVTKFVQATKAKSRIILDKLAKGTAVSAKDLTKAVEGVFVDSMSAASYAAGEVEKTAQGYKGLTQKKIIDRVNSTLKTREGRGAKAAASGAQVGSGTAVGNRAADRAAAKEAQKLAQDASKKEAEQIVESIQAKRGEVVATEQVTAAEGKNAVVKEENTAATVENTAATKTETAVTEKAVAATETSAVSTEVDAAATSAHTATVEASTAATGRSIALTNLMSRADALLVGAKSEQIALIDAQIAGLTAEQLSSKAGASLVAQRNEVSKKLATLETVKAKLIKAENATIEKGLGARNADLVKAKADFERAVKNASKEFDKLKTVAASSAKELASVASAAAPAAGTKTAAAGTKTAAAGTKAAATAAGSGAVATGSKKVIVTAADAAKMSGASGIVKAIEKQTLQFDSSLANFFKGPNFFQGPNIFQGKIITADKLNLKIKDSGKAAKDSAKALTSEDPLVKQARGRRAYTELLKRQESKKGVPYSDAQKDRLARLVGFKKPTMPAAMAATKASDMKARVLANIAASKAATEAARDAAKMGGLRSGISTGKAGGFAALSKPIPIFPGLAKMTAGVGGSFDKITKKISVLGEVGKKVTSLISNGFRSSSSLAGKAVETFAQKFVSRFLGMSKAGIDASSKMAKAMTYILSGTRVNIKEFERMNKVMKLLGRMDASVSKAMKNSAKEVSFVLRNIGTVVKTDLIGNFALLRTSLGNSKVLKIWSFLLFTGMTRGAGAVGLLIKGVKSLGSNAQRVEAVRVSLQKYEALRESRGLARTIPMFQRLIVAGSAYTGIGRGIKTVFSAATKTIFNMIGVAMKLNASLMLIAPVVILIMGLIIGLKSGLAGTKGSTDNLKEAWRAIKEAILALARPLMDLIGVFGGLGKASSGAGAVSNALNTMTRAVKAGAQAFERFAKGPGVQFMKNVLVPVITRLVNRFIMLGKAIGGLFKNDSAAAAKNFTGLFLSLAWEAVNAIQKIFGVLAEILPAMGPILASMIEAVLNATIDAFMYIMNFGKEVALFFGVMLTTIGLALSVFTGGAFLPVAGFGAALIAAAGAASLLDKHIGSVKKKVKGFSNTLGKGIADGLGAAAGYIQKDMLGSIKDKISEKYGEAMGKDINEALTNTMKDPADVKKAIKDALEGAVKDPEAANAAGESLGSAIAKGIKDKLISLKEDFTGAFFGKADDQVSKIVDDYKSAIDKQKEAALKAFDTQVEAIEALGKAEEELTAKMDYEEKRREMIKERAMNKENYLRERKIAKYEGRTEDVRSLDLSFRKTDKAAGKEITNLDTDRTKTLQEQQRAIAISVINREKDIMAETFDQMQKQFDINLAKILNKGFSTKEEFDSLLKEIGGAAQGFSGEINKVFEDTMFALPSTIAKYTDPSVGMFSITMDKLVTQAQMAFGANLKTGDAKSILGAAYAMANGLPDAFKQAFSDGIVTESVTPFVTKITTIMGEVNVDTIWIEAGRSAIEAMIGEMKRKLRALRGDLYDEFKTLFAGMGADYNQLFPDLEALAKQIAKIEAIRSQSGGGGGGDKAKKPVAPGGGGMGDDKIDMKAYSDGTPDKIGYKTVPDKKGSGFFGGMIDGIKSLVDYLGPVKTAILGVVGVFAGFFALQGLFSVIASAFETMMIIAMYAIQPIGTAAAGISATVAAVVAAIAVVIGVIIYMYIKFKWFRDMVNDTFNSVIDFFVTGFNMLKAPVMGFLGAVWDGVKQIFDSLFGPIIDFGKKIIAGILIAIGGVVAAIVGVLRGISIALDFIKEPLFKIIGWVINLATGIVNVLADIISGAIDFVYKIIGALFSVGIGGPIKLIIGAFKIAFDIIVGIVKIAIDLIIKAFDFLKGGLSGPFEVGFGIIKGIFDKIKDIVSGVIDFIKGIFGGFSFGDISGPITAPFKIAFDFIKDVFGKIFDVVKGVFENIVSFLQPIGETILKILIAPFKILFDVFKAIANNPIVVFFARVVAGLAIFAAIITTWGVKFVFEKLWEIISDVIKILHDLISVVWNKVSGAFNKVKDVVIGVWDKIYDKVSQFVDWFHEEFGSLWHLVLVPFAAIYEGMKWLWKYIKTHLGPIIQELWQNFKDGVDAVWGKITDFANWISSVFGGIWSGVKDIVSKVWAGIKDAVDIVWNKLLDFALWLNNIFEAAWDRIGPIISALWDGLKKSVDVAWNALKDFGSWLSDVFHKIWDGIGPILSKVWNGLTFAVSYVWDKLKAFGSWLSDVFGGAWSKISDVISKIWDGLKSAVDKVWESLKAFGSWVKDIFGGIWNKIGPILSQMWENFKNNTKFAWEQLKSFGSWLKDVFGKAWGSISDAIGDVWDKVSPIFGWIKDKISGAASAVWDVLKPAFDALRDVLKAFWEISRPIFDDFWGILEIIGHIINTVIIKPLQRLWDLIVAGWHLVEPIFNKMWDWLGPKIGAVIDYAKEAFKLFWGAIKDNWNDIKDIFSGVYTWLKDKIGWVINNLKELWDKFVQKIKDTWNSIVEIFQKIGDKISNAIGKAIDGITGAWDWFTTKMGEVWIKVKDIATNIGNWFKDKIGGAIDFISGLISAIPSTFKAAVNMVIGAWNDMWKWMDKFAFPGKIFGISLPGWIANKSISDFIGLPTIPLLKYNGGKIGTYMMGGMAYGSGGMTNGPVQQGIPAILHGGEYVLNHKAVARIGTDALDRLNNYKLSKPNLPSMPSVPSINMPGVGANNPQYAQSGTNSTQNVNIYVDNFIGEPEWFNTMMKTYNTTVLPRNQKSAGLESRVINSYNGLNRGL
jgi:phage-related protein